MAGSYERDWWLWPIVVTASTNGVVLSESGGSTFTVTIEAGTYFLHRDSSQESTYPSILTAIETALDAEATTNTYDFEVATPTQSVDQLTTGVRLVGASGAPSVSFSLDFSSGSFTLDPRVLGFLDTQSADVTSVAHGSDYAITAEYTCFGVWRAFSLFGGEAAEKRGDLHTLSIDSHKRGSDRYTLEWFEEEPYRTIIYEKVHAAHVYRYAARQSSYAVVGELAQYDTHNAFYHVWRQLKSGRACIVIHNVGDTWDLQIDAYDAEAVKRADSWPTSFREWTGEPVNQAGEFYTLRIPLYVSADIGGGYKH